MRFVLALLLLFLFCPLFAASAPRTATTPSSTHRCYRLQLTHKIQSSSNVTLVGPDELASPRHVHPSLQTIPVPSDPLQFEAVSASIIVEECAVDTSASSSSDQLTKKPIGFVETGEVSTLLVNFSSKDFHNGNNNNLRFLLDQHKLRWKLRETIPLTVQVTKYSTTVHYDLQDTPVARYFPVYETEQLINGPISSNTLCSQALAKCCPVGGTTGAHKMFQLRHVLEPTTCTSRASSVVPQYLLSTIRHDVAVGFVSQGSVASFATSLANFTTAKATLQGPKSSFIPDLVPSVSVILRFNQSYLNLTSVLKQQDRRTCKQGSSIVQNTNPLFFPFYWLFGPVNRQVGYGTETYVADKQCVGWPLGFLTSADGNNMDQFSVARGETVSKLWPKCEPYVSGGEVRDDPYNRNLLSLLLTCKDYGTTYMETSINLHGTNQLHNSPAILQRDHALLKLTDAFSFITPSWKSQKASFFTPKVHGISITSQNPRLVPLTIDFVLDITNADEFTGASAVQVVVKRCCRIMRLVQFTTAATIKDEPSPCTRVISDCDAAPTTMTSGKDASWLPKLYNFTSSFTSYPLHNATFSLDAFSTRRLHFQYSLSATTAIDVNLHGYCEFSISDGFASPWAYKVCFNTTNILSRAPDMSNLTRVRTATTSGTYSFKNTEMLKLWMYLSTNFAPIAVPAIHQSHAFDASYLRCATDYRLQTTFITPPPATGFVFGPTPQPAPPIVVRSCSLMTNAECANFYKSTVSPRRAFRSFVFRKCTVENVTKALKDHAVLTAPTPAPPQLPHFTPDPPSWMLKLVPGAPLTPVPTHPVPEPTTATPWWLTPTPQPATPSPPTTTTVPNSSTGPVIGNKNENNAALHTKSNNNNNLTGIAVVSVVFFVIDGALLVVLLVVVFFEVRALRKHNARQQQHRQEQEEVEGMQDGSIAVEQAAAVQVSMTTIGSTSAASTAALRSQQQRRQQSPHFSPYAEFYDVSSVRQQQQQQQQYLIRSRSHRHYVVEEEPEEEEEQREKEALVDEEDDGGDEFEEDEETYDAEDDDEDEEVFSRKQHYSTETGGTSKTYSFG